MRTGGGKNKGSGFEREVCKKLSLWLSSGEREDLLWRSSMSGGRATVALKHGKFFNAQSGDISSIDPRSSAFIEAYYIECKFYRNLQFAGLLDGKGNLAKFWREAKRQAKQFGKKPMLVGKQNHYPPFVILDSSCSSSLMLGVRPLIICHHLDFYLFDLKDLLGVGNATSF